MVIQNYVSNKNKMSNSEYSYKLFSFLSTWNLIKKK